MGDATEQVRWTDTQIREQLERILGHPEFRATEKMRAFLRFVVEETLAGRSGKLKGFTIATAVFDRGENFDAAHDPVVRVQAGRLRRALERYYLVAGLGDPIHIDIPKGGYVPTFDDKPPVPASRQVNQKRGWNQAEGWPSVVVLPFEDLTGRQELSYLASGLATDLGVELSSTGDLRVMVFRESLARVLGEEAKPDLVVCGSLRADGATVKVVVQLVSASSRELLWTDSLKFQLEDGALIEFQEHAAAAIAAHIAGRHGAIFRALTSKEGPSRKLSPNGDYAAILKSYAYQQSFDPDSYQAALAALNDAHSRNGRNGRNGIVSSMLAVLHVDNITLEFFDRSLTPLARARHLAQEGVQLDPVSQFGRLVLARVHLLEDDLDAGLAQVDKAQALQPTSLLHLDLIGYLRVLLGDWERGEALVRQAIDLNPFHEVFTRYATYLCFLHRGDVEQAMEETQWLEGVGYFWDPLARAACLGLLGRRDEAREAVAQLLALKPDFAARGAVLIGHCVKCPDLRRMMAEGLAAGGLRLDDVAG